MDIEIYFAGFRLQVSPASDFILCTTDQIVQQ